MPQNYTEAQRWYRLAERRGYPISESIRHWLASDIARATTPEKITKLRSEYLERLAHLMEVIEGPPGIIPISNVPIQGYDDLAEAQKRAREWKPKPEQWFLFTPALIARRYPRLM